jgi:hypothetical protein
MQISKIILKNVSFSELRHLQFIKTSAKHSRLLRFLVRHRESLESLELNGVCTARPLFWTRFLEGLIGRLKLKQLIIRHFDTEDYDEVWDDFL